MDVNVEDGFLEAEEEDVDGVEIVEDGFGVKREEVDGGKWIDEEDVDVDGEKVEWMKGFESLLGVEWNRGDGDVAEDEMSLELRARVWIKRMWMAMI